MRARSIAVLLALTAALARPAGAAGHVYERVTVPMRDGVELSVDIWRPDAPGTVPVILTLTPYHVLNKALDRVETDLPADYGWLVGEGYAYARADVRGTYNSGGCWDYGGLKERQDGYDLVEWLAGFERDPLSDPDDPTWRPSPAAAWSSGTVAMTGASYDGTTANAAAVERPPHLRTIVPISAISRWWGYAYQQGARSLYSGESADIDPPSDTPTDFMFAYGFLPPPDPDALRAQQLAMRWTPCDRVEKALRGYVGPDYDDFWIERDYLRSAHLVNVPVLVAHGLQDYNVKTWEGTAWFQAITTEKTMVIGQWPHASPDGRYPGWRSLLRKWFARWLKGEPNDVENEPAVRVQSTDGAWRTQETWGAGVAAAITLSGTDATYLDDGLLTESEMLRGLSAGRWVRIPVTGPGGARIEGRPVLHLRARSDSPGTHFVAVLCDVSPAGTCSVVSRAFIDARYRNTLEHAEALTPGQWETIDLEFIDRDHVVPAADHLELFVASASTTWVVPDVLRATNTISPSGSVLDLPLRSG